MAGGRPGPSSVTIPGTSPSARSGSAASSAGAPTSPSPLSTASIAPSACPSTCSATNDTLCPPTNTVQPGSSVLIHLARFTTSGTLAR